MGGSTLVVFDNLGGSYGRVIGVASGRAYGAALAKQVPAPVKLDFDVVQALVLLALADLMVGELGPQLLLLLDERVDEVVDATVSSHESSLGPVQGSCWTYRVGGRLEDDRS